MGEFNNWAVGTKTGSGTISRIFHLKKDSFIIYEVDYSGWFLFDSIGDISKNFSEIQTQWSDVTNLLIENKAKKRYIGKMAGVLKESLLGENLQALSKLESIRRSVIDYKTTIGRIVYFLGAVAMAVFFVLLIIAISYINLTDNLLLDVIFYSLLGSILSVGINLSKIKINIQSGTVFIYFFMGSLRVIISSISAIVLFLLIQGKLILGTIDFSNQYTLFCFGIISGFSEAFIPNLLIRVKDSEDQKQ